MSANLSKLHVRFIQSQKNFQILQQTDAKSTRLPLTQLYIKDNNNFYLISHNDKFNDEQELTISFDEPTPALNTLSCTTTVHLIQPESEAFEDALMFFNTEAEDVKQVLLLSIQEIC